MNPWKKSYLRMMRIVDRLCELNRKEAKRGSDPYFKGASDILQMLSQDFEIVAQDYGIELDKEESE